MLEDVAFEYDVFERKLKYPADTCPYKKIDKVGLGSVGTNDEGEQGYIYDLVPDSPAVIAGLKNGDILERIRFPNGTIVEKIPEDYLKHRDEFLYGQVGVTYQYDVVREGKIVSIPVTTREPNFIDFKTASE